MDRFFDCGRYCLKEYRTLQNYCFVTLQYMRYHDTSSKSMGYITFKLVQRLGNLLQEQKAKTELAKESVSVIIKRLRNKSVYQNQNCRLTSQMIIYRQLLKLY